MTPELYNFITGLLERHRTLTIATNRADGWPQATTVNYVNDGIVLYSFIARVSQKFANIQRDPRVSIAIAREFSTPQEIQGLSMAARAEFVADRREFDRVSDLFFKRNPELNSWGHPNPKLSPLVRMVPQFISVIDYAKMFGRGDLIKISTQDLRPRSADRGDSRTTPFLERTLQRDDTAILCVQ